MIVIFLFFVVLMSFIFVPRIKHKIDRNGGQCILTIFVSTASGNSLIRTGASIVRFSLYEKYMVTCMATAKQYSYKNIKIDEPFKTGSCKLILVICGTKVRLRGSSNKLEAFYRELSKRL